jgi:uncharacterized protein (TIGR02284 family)
MSEPATQNILEQLYRTVEAGEKGYATAATNTPNPGLKILFKIYAQQRAKFKEEIRTEIQRSTNDFNPGISIPAMIHRGRVTIFAAMTIEKETQEKVILKEVALGEKFAVRAYTKVLKSNLSEITRTMIEHQLEVVRQASSQINLLLGHEGRQLIVHLENDADPNRPAELLLKDVELLAEVSQKISVSDSDLYQGKGATVLETVVSGAFGGALWGGLAGLLVGFGVLQTVSPSPILIAEILGIWVLTALAFLLLGAFVASGLAFFIGAGISQDDSYQVREIIEANPVLVQTLVGISQATDKA